MSTDNLDAFIRKQLVSTAMPRRTFLTRLATTVLVGSTAACGLQQSSDSSTPTSDENITIKFAYSTEKEGWIQAAVDIFNLKPRKTSDGIFAHVKLLDETGSLDAADKIVAAKKNDPNAIKPTAWSPASSLELAYLKEKWPEIIADTGDQRAKSLVSSPLVFAVYKNRVTTLSSYGSLNWDGLHRALQAGKMKFGQTRSDQSNSGLLTITLIAYAYFHEQNRLTRKQIQDAGFLKYLDDFEGGIVQFGRSSGTFLSHCVNPKFYDVITTYENLMLKFPNQQFKIYYPDPNLYSDHPFAILQWPGMTDKERNAAICFREFLLEQDQQRLALTYGFRPPINNYAPKFQITDNIPGNVFLQFLKTPDDSGFQQDIPPPAQYPKGEVVDELLTQWKNNYDGASTCTS